MLEHGSTCSLFVMALDGDYQLAVLFNCICVALWAVKVLVKLSKHGAVAETPELIYQMRQSTVAGGLSNAEMKQRVCVQAVAARVDFIGHHLQSLSDACVALCTSITSGQGCGLTLNQISCGEDLEGARLTQSHAPGD